MERGPVPPLPEAPGPRSEPLRPPQLRDGLWERGHRTPYRLRGRGKRPGTTLVLRQRRSAGDETLELVQRQVPDRLENLLVGPADFTRLLVEVDGRGSFRIQGLLEVGEEGSLLGIGGGEAAGFGDLVEAQSGPPRRFRVLGDAVVVLTV